MGQAKRRHVLRYLAARESAGIDGTGPFDLADTLTEVDLMLAQGRPWAKALAEELASTGQRWDCERCEGRGFLEGEQQADEREMLDWLIRAASLDPAAVQRIRCSRCGGTGHNIRARLPWPAWLRRKGVTMASIRGARSRSPARVGGWPVSARVGAWSSPSFSTTCSTAVERMDHADEVHGCVVPPGVRVETRTREYPRGQHRERDPWAVAAVEMPARRSWSALSPRCIPRWRKGELRHLEQRRAREQARRQREAVAYITPPRDEWAADASGAITGIRRVTEYQGPNNVTVSLGSVEDDEPLYPAVPAVTLTAYGSIDQASADLLAASTRAWRRVPGEQPVWTEQAASAVWGNGRGWQPTVEAESRDFAIDERAEHYAHTAAYVADLMRRAQPSSGTVITASTSGPRPWPEHGLVERTLEFGQQVEQARRARQHSDLADALAYATHARLERERRAELEQFRPEQFRFTFDPEAHIYHHREDPRPSRLQGSPEANTIIGNYLAIGRERVPDHDGPLDAARVVASWEAHGRPLMGGYIAFDLAWLDEQRPADSP